MIGRVLSVLVFGLLAPAGYGAPSGLNIMPTADMLPHAGIAVEVERISKPLRLTRQADTSMLLQAGVGGRAELGCDICSDGDQVSAWNLKLAVAERRGSPALAFGVQNVGDNQKPQLYAVGHLHSSRGRIHLGLLHSDGAVRPMLGYDSPLSRRIILQADFTAGDENSSSLGVAASLGKTFGITAAYVRANSGSDRHSLIVLVGWYYVR